MKALLIVSALLLMVRETPTKGLNENLNAVFEEARKCKNSYNKTFVEDLAALVDSNNRCTDQFFCKTYYILKSHLIKKGRLLGNLKKYIDTCVPNCVESRENATSTATPQTTLSDLLNNLCKCIQKSNSAGPTAGSLVNCFPH